ncbi:MAG: transglycosylase SLT domain-containing protein [Rhodocyclaceae bacterium]|nr:transglycosylase SLT domain-containing protein [Rhodocyclaceae bacterium]
MRAELVDLHERPLQVSSELTLPIADDSRRALDLQVAPVAAPPIEIRDDLPPLPTIDLTASPDDLYQRMRNGFGMPDLASPLVAERQAWYLNRPEMLKRILERSRKYLYHIVVELEKRGMPTELALLPIVESSFNPLAYSRARALGIWQFIPSTGRTYNLKQNWWLDERRDILASTSAALDYLQAIYEMHGDWHLALASYNWGENAVARAIAKNAAKGLPTDYEHLSMPGETRYYVPKLQAIKNIIAQPELFGLHLDPIPNKPYFGTVDMNVDVDIATVAKLAETSIDEFVALNPSYQRPVIPSESTSPLVIPFDKMQIFQANLARYEAQDKPLSTWHAYQLKPGEKLQTVAARFHLSVARLKQLNGITPRTKIAAGQKLLVPTPGATSPDLLAGKLPKAAADAPHAGRGGKHKAAGKGTRIRKPGHGVKKATPGKGKKRH